MEVQAITRNVRLSPTKARDLAARVKGMPVGQAQREMSVSDRKAAIHIGKTLKSAIANAENNADLSADDLIVKSATVDEGRAMKRFWPRARGMVSRIRKRSCHIRIVLTDGN
jgi:large subunit ribosomal protein L22